MMLYYLIITVVETGVLRGSELVRLAMMLQEATAICRNLNKPLTFSREEAIENGEVCNTLAACDFMATL